MDGVEREGKTENGGKTKRNSQLEYEREKKGEKEK